MIPVLTAAQMRRADAYTIAHTPIASLDLMERAAEACTQWLDRAYPVALQRPFAVVCGPGNNGGDGLVIARLLHARGHIVRVLLCTGGRALSPDAATNSERLARTAVPVIEVLDEVRPVELLDNELIIDALFGTGLDRPLEGVFHSMVQAMNRSRAVRISIDLPSGLLADGVQVNAPGAIVRADTVLTFQCAKPALLLPENEAFVGGFEVLDIGLLPEGIAAEGATMHLLEARDVRRLLPNPGRFAHKGRNGHALLIAGGPGRAGAAVLAARAAVRSGAGLITVQLPPDLQPVIHAAVPEAMCATIHPADTVGTGRFTAVAIGPGIGVDEHAAQRFEHVLRKAGVPLVIDADALSLLAQEPTRWSLVPAGSVLTPHPGEMDRLVGDCASGYERLQRARELAVQRRVVIVLKGAYTAICAPDGSVVLNTTGNPGMAKGGSGDALTGLLAGLLAQGMDPLSAAMAGVFAHGLAGDLAAAALGQQGMTVSDLIAHLPLAWRRIRESA